MKLSKKQQVVAMMMHLPLLPVTLTFAVLGSVSGRIRRLDVFLTTKLHSFIKSIK